MSFLLPAALKSRFHIIIGFQNMPFTLAHPIAVLPFSRCRKGNPRRVSFQTAKVVTTKKSALPRLETRVAFADNVDLAPAAHDLAVAVALFGGFQGR